MRPSKQAEKAAQDIWNKYARYLEAPHMGNQSESACKQTIAEIISRHCDGEPAWLNEALNSGDGVYRP